MTVISVARHPPPHKTSVPVMLVAAMPEDLGPTWLMPALGALGLLSSLVTLNMLFVVVSRLMISVGVSSAD